MSLRDHIHNQTIRQMSVERNIVVAIRENKIRWIGHVARLTDKPVDVAHQQMASGGKKRPPG